MHDIQKKIKAGAYICTIVRRLTDAVHASRGELMVDGNTMLPILLGVSLENCYDRLHTLPVSDVTELFLQPSVDRLQQRLDRLVAFSLVEYSSSLYTAIDIYQLLGIPTESELADKLAVERLNLENYKDVISRLVEQHRPLLEDYMEFASAAMKRYMAIVEHNCVEKNVHRVQYYGAYDLDWNRFLSADAQLSIERMAVDPMDMQLLQLALADVRHGEAVFYNNRHHAVYRATDMARDSSSRLLTDTIIEKATTFCIKAAPLPSDVGTAAEHYEMLRPS